MSHNKVTYVMFEPRRDDLEPNLDASSSWFEVVALIGGLTYNVSCLALRPDADVVGNVTWSVIFVVLLTFTIAGDVRRLRSRRRRRLAARERLV